MTPPTRSYRLLSLTLVLGLLLQALAPTFLWRAAPVVAAETAVAEMAAPPTIDAQTTAVPTQPESLAHPLTVARVQSGYGSGDPIVITYTLSNNQLPTLEPIQPGATPTDTIASLSGFILTEDMNTARNVTFALTLTAASLIDAPGATQNGHTLAWTLPDIAPLQTAQITLTVQPPPTAADFVALDSGGRFAAELWGDLVAHTARPAVVIPDSVSGAYMAAAPEANLYDPDALWIAGKFQQDPLAAYAYVQSMAYQPYHGSLRGAFGVLMGQAGNSLDQASLLIAMLRAAGVPARYRHGSLSPANAQIVLGGMFASDFIESGLAGYLPDGAATADPLDDPHLIALAQDHWWVEAYLPGQGWTDLDPVYPGAVSGQSFAAPGVHDRSAAIPDELRHALTVSLEVEQFVSFPIGGVNLTRFTPLTATFPTAQVAGRALILGHLVETETPGGVIFGVTQHSYAPFIAVNGADTLFVGDSFTDLLTNFPLASQFTVAEWLHFTITAPDGGETTFTRDVKDLIGKEARLNGGAPVVELGGDDPFITYDDTFIAQILPNQIVNREFIRRQRAQVFNQMLALAQTAANYPEELGSSPEEAALAAQTRLQFDLARAAIFAMAGVDFAQLADQTAADIAAYLGVTMFYEQPRVVIVSSAVDGEGNVTRAMDLRNTAAVAIAHPGQAASAVTTAQWLKGIAESDHEGFIATFLQNDGGVAVTVFRIFSEMADQGIEPLFLTPAELDLLDLYLPDPRAYAYAAAALLAGKSVLIPQAPVNVDGQMILGWWEIDPQTGAAVSVLENGLHGALIEYATLVEILDASVVFKNASSLAADIAKMYMCIASALAAAGVGGRSNIEAADCAWKPSFSYPRAGETAVADANWRYLPAHLCPIDNCGLEQFALTEMQNAPMPLPEIGFAYNDRLTSVIQAGMSLEVNDNGQGGPPTITLNPAPASGSGLPAEPISFVLTAEANFDDLLEAWLFTPDGWRAEASGATFHVTAPAGTPPGEYTLQLVAQAVSDRQVVAAQSYTVAIVDANQLELTAVPEPYITVPLNPPLIPAVSNQTNDGQAEIPDAAYRLILANQSGQPRAVNLSVSGAPEGWLVLNGARQSASVVELPANGRANIGLYIAPPNLPAPGASLTLNVVAEGGGLSANEQIIWTMPGQAHNFLEVPAVLYVEAGGSVDFDLTMRNVGNASGSFPIAITTPLTTAVITNYQSPITLSPGESDAQTPTLQVGAAVLGRRYPVQFGSPAPGGYTQYALSEIRIVSPESGRLFAAANSCTINDSLGAKLEALALAVVELEYWCGVGDCPLQLRDQAAAAGQLVVSGANVAASPTVLPALSGVETAVAALSAAANDNDILTAVADLSLAVESLSSNLCEVERHRVNGRFTPYVQAILLGDSASFSLEVTNQGTVTTTYNITVAGLSPSPPLLFSPSLPPGETISLPITPAPITLGSFNLTADIVADIDGQVDVRKTAVARLNVVDKFVQVTQVIADPPFVETGVSATSLSVEVANFAGVGLASVAETAVFAPDGSQQFNATVPLNILAGNPRVYELVNVNTSGWAAGVYTITIDLLDEDDNLIPDGAGYGYFSVGQALQLSQAVYPEIVAPGTVTVTTIISSEISSQSSVNSNQSGTMYDAPLTAADEAYLNRTADVPTDVGAGLVPAHALSQPNSGQPEEEQTQEGQTQGLPLQDDQSVILTPLSPTNEPSEDDSFTIHNSQFTIHSYPTFTRTEQTDPAWSYIGTWSNVNLGRASGGSHWRNATASSAAELTFDGTWVSLGFITDRWSGYATITIDGDSYGTLDLYRNEETATSFLFDGLPAGSHTLLLTVQGSGNPFAQANRVQLDYADFGDGSALPDGDFEQDDGRLLTSNVWTTTTYAGASGGSYIASNTGTAWFPFAGDSFTLHSMAHSNAGKARLFVDGVYLDTIDMFAPVFPSAALTRVFSYEGLGSGPHILQIVGYQGQTTIDKLTTPGSGPFIDPNPPVTGITRFEADHPVLLYNGVPFTQTATTWTRVADANATRASAGEYIRSGTANDTIAFTFEGTWLGIGFTTDTTGGQAEIAIDGQPVETIDLYSYTNDTASVYYRNLGAGSHTVTITVLGTRHPNSSGDRIHFDYFDVWDGQPLAEGTFEEDGERLILSNGWWRTLDPTASGGAYASSTQNVTAWFPFTGDSFTYHGRTRFNYQELELRLNGQSLGQFDLYSYEEDGRTYSFDNLGAGPHVLEIRQYRDPVTVDAVSSPAIEPAYEPPAPAPIVRYEENHPAMRYNGHPFRTMPQNWNIDGGVAWSSSGGNSVSASTAGNSWSMSFDGQWVNLGFRSSTGQVEIFINGASQGIFDTSGGVNGVKNFPFTLTPGSHTVQVVAISGIMAPDYMDVWQGASVADGWYDALFEDEATGLFHFSYKRWWQRAADTYAYNGMYLYNFASAANNIWFNFVGTDLTILGNQRDGTSLHIVIDGVNYGVFDMSTPAPFRGQPLALHFPDLGEGAHTVQVFLPSTGSVTARIDAFEVNPADFYSYMPEIKWYDTAPTVPGSNPDFYNNGLMSSIAIGDLDGDGVVELVAPATNGTLYVYRGDGQDAGGGSPLIWSTAVVGVAAEPALADLTDNGRAEIVLSGYTGTYAFAHDGTQLWHNPDPRAVVTDSGGTTGWGGPTIGNLDLDPEPEIVIAASQDALYVLDHMGNTLWSVPVADRFVTIPVLADITGDGILDIIVADKWDLRVYDYFNGGQLVWQYTQPDGLAGGQGAFGAPAVADITGDGQPEIIINWGVFIEALRADGSLLWKYNTGNNAHFRPSPVTVADVTGDGQMNLITASAISAGFVVLNHTLMVLDADGNLVWEQLVGDNSASASGVAAQDLTGNGVWEVIWNGAADGFLILRGSDGKRLFNEPFTRSGTVTDYPTLGDVDGDGVADVVLGGRNGIFVISHIGRWVDSRPLWNQHNYHVTNINDDWSVPINEPNSWELHNSYRTQTPDRSPAPSYQIVFTYTEGLPDVTVLTHTASISLTAVPPIYGWEYRQEWYQPVITTTFDSLLTGMQPGETRQVSAGTEVAYRLPSGFNYLTLPPLYVTAPGLGELSPVAQSVVIGGTAVYTLTLSNVGDSAAVYSLFPGGIPAAWLSYPATVPVGAGETVIVTITITIPPNADPDTLTLWLDVDNGSGGADDFTAELTLFNGLELALTPFSQAGTTGRPLTYTLTISNLETAERTYALTTGGLADVSLPNSVTVAGNGVEMVTVTAVPLSHGPQPFAITASAANGATANVDGAAVGDGRFGLLAQFNPETAITGPGATAVYTLTLTNIGDTADSYSLDLDIPAGWTAELTRYGQPISAIDLPALLFNSVELLLLVTPDENALADSYPITLTAVSLNHDGVGATAGAIAEVTARGVSVAISPASQTVDPTAPAAWDITVTNTGSVADSFDLVVSGAPALAGTLSADTVTLAPGASQTVQITAADLRFLLPGEQSFAVMAQSQADGQIRAEDRASFVVDGFVETAVFWQPESKTVTNTLTMALTFVISNTGNLFTEFEISFVGAGLTAESDTTIIAIPPRGAALLLVEVMADEPGSYTLLGSVTGDGATAEATATLTFAVDGENQPPIVDAGPNQQALVNQPVQFSGGAVDPDGDEIVSIVWDFGDGNTATGTFTPTHSYTAVGDYTVTLTVTDGRGGVGQATAVVSVKTAVYIPIIMNAP